MSLNHFLRTCYIQDRRLKRRVRWHKLFAPALAVALWIALYVVFCVTAYFLRFEDVSLKQYPANITRILTWPQTRPSH